MRSWIVVGDYPLLCPGAKKTRQGGESLPSFIRRRASSRHPHITHPGSSAVPTSSSSSSSSQFTVFFAGLRLLRPTSISMTRSVPESKLVSNRLTNNELHRFDVKVRRHRRCSNTGQVSRKLDGSGVGSERCYTARAHLTILVGWVSMPTSVPTPQLVHSYVLGGSGGPQVGDRQCACRRAHHSVGGWARSDVQGRPWGRSPTRIE